MTDQQSFAEKVDHFLIDFIGRWSLAVDANRKELAQEYLLRLRNDLIQLTKEEAKQCIPEKRNDICSSEITSLLCPQRAYNDAIDKTEQQIEKSFKL